MLHSKVREEGERKETTTKTTEKRKRIKRSHLAQAFKSKQELFHILHGKNDEREIFSIAEGRLSLIHACVIFTIVVIFVST